MNDIQKLVKINRMLKVWQIKNEFDSNKLMKWFSDIKNDGGYLPESTVSLDSVLKELEEVFSE